jgi:16S rRNA (adenine1518-N6/adenine1519-N6)-dimethyltransferase
VSVSGRVRPRKALGQHWLSDRKALNRIAEAGEIGDDDTVIEIGAGTGLLTEELAKRAKRLIAVEVDERLAEKLRGRFADDSNVSVLQADMLTTPAEELLVLGNGRVPYVVVGNLPYFIGTAIVRRFLQAMIQPRWMVVTLQAEVAESMTALPGRMRALSVQTQMLASARILFYLPPKAFTPPPKVRSAVVRLDVLDAPEVEVDDHDSFFNLVHAGFAAPRKRLRNSLAIGLGVAPDESSGILAAAGLDPTQRPAQVSLAGWRDLYFAFRAAKGR